MLNKAPHRAAHTIPSHPTPSDNRSRRIRHGGAPPAR